MVVLPKTANLEHMKTNADVDFVISDEDMELLKDVEKITSIKTLAELLDCLGTNTVNAEKVFFGLTNQIPNRLNTNLGELIGPALGNPKVVKEVQLSILT